MTKVHAVLRRIGCQPSIASVPDVFKIHSNETRFGRNHNNDVFLDSTLLPNFISRKHALIEIVENEDGEIVFYLSDMSLNGSYVNEVRVDGKVELQTKDVIKFGHTQGSKIKRGMLAPQPLTEFSFMFEKCSKLEESSNSLCGLSLVNESAIIKNENLKIDDTTIDAKHDSPNLSVKVEQVPDTGQAQTDGNATDFPLGYHPRRLQMTPSPSIEPSVPVTNASLPNTAKRKRSTESNSSSKINSNKDKDESSDSDGDSSSEESSGSSSDGDDSKNDSKSLRKVPARQALSSLQNNHNQSKNKSLNTKTGKRGRPKAKEVKQPPQPKTGTGNKKKNSGNNWYYHDEKERCASTKCVGSCDPKINWVCCDDCEGWYHTNCVGIPFDQVKKMDKFHCGCT